ncbi:hypothetical protein [Actinoplanes sp. HUAS TT8]|uniref:hypothetical protein n=1 Tax=Actinoplanes sp. HUAS TT8 TaxID=3447453 RepID=UPI003F51BE0E
MKVLKLAVGFAAGYVLGTRAGREKFEQIAAYARKASNHPTAVQAQEKAKTLLATGTQAVVAKLPHTDTTATSQPVTVPATTPPVSTPSPVRQPKPARTVPSGVGGDPLV